MKKPRDEAAYLESQADRLEQFGYRTRTEIGRASTCHSKAHRSVDLFNAGWGSLHLNHAPRETGLFS